MPTKTPILRQKISHHAQSLSIKGLFWMLKGTPLGLRGQVMGRLCQALTWMTPGLWQRVDKNLRSIYPQMCEHDRRILVRQVARNAGRTLTEILYNAEYATIASAFPVKGEGAAALRDAHARGRGAILISGHFGQWEAIRHALRAEGMEIGAVYRRNNNPDYEKLFLAGIEKGGHPIIAKGDKAHLRTMLKHLRKGGIVALLVDQHANSGAAWLTFMGQPAATSLSAAEMALRYGIPLIPVFGIRNDTGVEVVIENPLRLASAAEMMQAFNHRLEHHVRAHPDQWYWYHTRWREAPQTCHGHQDAPQRPERA